MDSVNILKLEHHACNKDMQLKHESNWWRGKKKNKITADIFADLSILSHDESSEFQYSLQVNNNMLHENFVTDFSTMKSQKQ